MKKIIYAALLLMVVALPLLALADDQPVILVKGVSDLCRTLRNLINIVFSIIMIIAVIFILLAAFNYLTAAGSTEKVEAATGQVRNAVIAVVIAVLAWSIPSVIVSFMYHASGNGNSPLDFSCNP